jgi:hypothetical protein
MPPRDARKTLYCHATVKSPDNDVATHSQLFHHVRGRIDDDMIHKTSAFSCDSTWLPWRDRT